MAIELADRTDGAAVCQATNFTLLPSAGRRIFRVAQAKYGATAPPPRTLDADADTADWNRWDTPGRTLYGCSSEVGALMEVLGYIRPDPPSIPLEDLFDDVGAGDMATLAEQIALELPAHGGMPYRSIPKAWRDARQLYELHLPVTGWFIDIADAGTIATVSATMPNLLAAHDIADLTLSELTASTAAARRLTTAIATEIRARVVLDDGSLPHGIAYPSKKGTSLHNWALWMRRTDDGTGHDINTRTVLSSALGRHSPELIKAAKNLGIDTAHIY